MPRVLNFHDFKRGGLPSSAVYIGRAGPTYGLPSSKWANRFMIGRRDCAREKEVIETYERWLRADVRACRGRKNFGPPMTLVNMRQNSVRTVIARCEACGHAADVDVRRSRRDSRRARSGTGACAVAAMRREPDQYAGPHRMQPATCGVDD